MVIKQGGGYKPRGNTSAIVGTSKVQLQLPLEAGPGQAWAGRQEHGPMRMGTVLHDALPEGCLHSPAGAKELAVSLRKQLWKIPASPLPVEAQPLRVALHVPALAASVCDPCPKPARWHTGKAHMALLCPGPGAWLGLQPGETAFQQVHELPNIGQVWADGDVLCLISVQKKHFYYQTWSVQSLNICCSLLGAADRAITGGLWFTTFVFVYICVSRKVAICQIWKCLIRSDGQIN